MVVKSRIGRKRYIVFDIQADRLIGRGELIHAIHVSARRMGLVSPQPDHETSHRVQHNEDKGLQGPDPKYELPWLLLLHNNRGLVRVNHRRKNDAISILTAITRIGRDAVPVTIQTMRTSGSIRKLKLAYFS